MSSIYSAKDQSELATLCMNADLYVKQDGWMIGMALQDMIHFKEKNRRYCLSAIFEDGKPVACAVLDKRERQVGVFVDPSHRRKGYGKKAFWKLLHEHNIDPDTIYATEGQEGSEEFYGSLDCLFFKDGLTMTKQEGDLLMTFGATTNAITQILRNANRRRRKEPVDIRILPKFSDEHYFKNIGGNRYIAYHVEGGETLILSGGRKLSMETLTDKRPLFLCNNPEQWWPSHIDEYEEYRLLEIEFEAPPGIEFYKNKTYHSLFSFNDKDYELTMRTKSLMARGLRLFVLPLLNDCGELSEAFLLEPTKYVKSIKVIKRDGDHF